MISFITPSFSFFEKCLHCAKKGAIILRREYFRNTLLALTRVRAKVHKEVTVIMTQYEINYIIRPNIDEAAKAELVQRFDAILTDNGAEIIESKDWSKRRLAYEINDFREGIYHIVKIQSETAESIQEFDRLAKINNDILRHIIVKEEA